MISCILLAAGESVRFGSPKALASINGQPVLCYILAKLLKTRLSEIVVVLGANAEEINPLIPTHPRIKNIVNKNYRLGQTSSFQTGLEITAPETRGVMLLPLDMPFITSATIDLLIETFLTEAPPLLVPTYKGKNGHPPLFSRRLLQEFRDLKTEEPLSSIQHRHANETRKLEVADQGIFLSFNTPQEFEKIKFEIYGNGLRETD
jgi:molybdenum cofactor cytidylyltransferase